MCTSDWTPPTRSRPTATAGSCLVRCGAPYEAARECEADANGYGARPAAVAARKILMEGPNAAFRNDGELASDTRNAWRRDPCLRQHDGRRERLPAAGPDHRERVAGQPGALARPSRPARSRRGPGAGP